jgi:hypothetical protein
MAFTTTQLAELEQCYAAGVTTVHHSSGHTVTYANMADLWMAILRVRRALNTSATATHGVIRFRKDS